jgi:hypothetical protein
VTEIRSKFRDVHVAFLYWAALYRNKTKSRYKDGEEVLEKIRDLSVYYEARKPWPDSRTRNMLEATKEEINNWLIELMGAAAATELRDPRSDEDEVAERVYKWVGSGLFQREEFPRAAYRSSSRGSIKRSTGFLAIVLGGIASLVEE